MKKLLMGLLLALSSVAGASSTQNIALTMTAEDDQSVAKTAAFIYAQDQSLTYTATDRRLVANSSGHLLVAAPQAMTVAGTVTANQGSAIWAVSVTASTAYVSVSNPAYTVLSSTATTKNVTAEAGTSANYDIWVCNNYGGSAIRYAITYSASAPSDLSTRGNYLSATSTTQVSGPWAPGAHLHMYSVGTVATGNDVSVYMARRGFNSANP